MSQFYITPTKGDGAVNWVVIRVTERTIAGPFGTYAEAEAELDAAYQREERLGGRHLTTSELEAVQQAITAGAVGPEFMRGES